MVKESNSYGISKTRVNHRVHDYMVFHTRRAIIGTKFDMNDLIEYIDAEIPKVEQSRMIAYVINFRLGP